MKHTNFKRILSMLLLMAMLVCMLAGCVTEEDDSDISRRRSRKSQKETEPSETEPVPEEPEAPILDPQEIYLGNIITFGTFEQDNNLANGAEPIQWQVAQVQNGRAMLVSRYVLDSRAYHSVDTDITWDQSTIRKWLNGEFLSSAFTEDEQMLIAETTNSGGGHPDFTTYAGPSTTDRIFLLSYAEVLQYFPTEAARQCAPTQYAVIRGVDVSDGCSWWWLRSPGRYQYFALGVRSNGELFNSGDKISYTDGGIRPVMWVVLG